MTTIPFTEQEVAEDCLVLNLEKVGLSDEQFIELCSDNRELQLELTARKELVIMTLPGARTGLRNTVITVRLAIWAEKDGTGIAFGQGPRFGLPNGARRAPDAAWLRREKWNSLTDDQKEKMPPFCPDFVLELMSPSDRRPARFKMIQAKMAEYIENGAQLGWFIDPFEKKVYVYRPDRPVECLENPTTLSGDPILPGFVLSISEVWQR
jgi:Uma2 family endonuclease